MAAFTVEVSNVNTGRVVYSSLVDSVNKVLITLESGRTLAIYTTNEADVLSCVVGGGENAESVAVRMVRFNAFKIEMR